MEEWTDFNPDQLKGTDRVALFLYTPLCGTCKVAERMLHVVENLVTEYPIRKINLNYFPDLAAKWEIQSVPCLLLFEKGEMTKRIYAFQSVDYLYRELK
ncbi:thioredoxin family protein [Bacillus pinisoli]|uniref:thioredoxin family protein n=1 Tax=Bacillus pinisoli TaxID=2901866 RepID=UPI001FF67944|nr:thioredoxin family protein [Bacillus pinisoli]